MRPDTTACVRLPWLTHGLLPLLGSALTGLLLLAALVTAGGEVIKQHVNGHNAPALQTALQAVVLFAVPVVLCVVSVRQARRGGVARTPVVVGVALTALVFGCINIGLTAATPGGQASLGAGIGFSTEPMALLALSARVLSILALTLLLSRSRD